MVENREGRREKEEREREKMNMRKREMERQGIGEIGGERRERREI